VSDLEFFDVNLTLGKPRVPMYSFTDDAAKMREDLAPLGITGGLVRHMLGPELHPLVGNERLDSALPGAGGFEPCWDVMPNWTSEFLDPAHLAGKMREGRARSVVLHPRQLGFPLRDPVAGPLLAALERMRAPCFLPEAEVDLADVEAAAAAHPALPLVVSDTSYRLARELYPVLENRANVYLEISGYTVHRGIEDICRRFGAGRLLFGSRYPAFQPACAVAAVTWAKTAEADRRRIARENALELLGEVKI